MNQFIPLSIPNFEGNEKKYVDEALDLGWVSTGGAFITRLEKDLASFLHTEEVAACQSGTAALHLSLVEAADLGIQRLKAGPDHNDLAAVIIGDLSKVQHSRLPGFVL